MNSNAQVRWWNYFRIEASSRLVLAVWQISRDSFSTVSLAKLSRYSACVVYALFVFVVKPWPQTLSPKPFSPKTKTKGPKILDSLRDSLRERLGESFWERSRERSQEGLRESLQTNSRIKVKESSNDCRSRKYPVLSKLCNKFWNE